MAVSLRLQRRGKVHQPFFHIVVADSRRARDGRFIEKIGYYDPRQDPSLIVMKEDRIQYWFGRGARPSPTVATLLKKKNIKPTRLNVSEKRGKKS